MKALARFVLQVTLWVVAGLLASGLVSVGLGGVLARREAAAEVPMGEAVRLWMEAHPALSLSLGIVPTALAFALLALALARREELRLTRPRALDVALGAAGMIGVSSAAGALVSLAGLVDGGALEELNRLFGAMSAGERLAMIPVTALCPGVAEELFFRGLVLGRGERAVGVGAATIVSALAFGAVHLDPGHVIAASMMGLYLAFVVSRTGSLVVTIVAHVANNVLATLAPELNSSGAHDVGEALFAVGVGSAVGVAATFAIARRYALKVPSSR